MTITSAIVLLSVYWFITLFIVLPINVTTQNDERNVIGVSSTSSTDLTDVELKQSHPAAMQSEALAYPLDQK